MCALKLSSPLLIFHSFFMPLPLQFSLHLGNPHGLRSLSWHLSAGVSPKHSARIGTGHRLRRVHRMHRISVVPIFELGDCPLIP